MRKLIKIILWIIGSLLSLCIIGLFSTYIWLSTKWKDFYTEKEMIEISKQIENAETLPDYFYIAYDKVYPAQRDKTLKQMSFETIWFVLTNNQVALREYRQCNSIWASSFIENKFPVSYHSWTSYIIAHGLEEYTTEKKCLDYCFNKIGINDLSIEYFSKPLRNLTPKENLGYYSAAKLTIECE